MSEEELRDQINKIASKIMEVEEGAKKKETYIKNKIDEKFNNKISENESKLQVGQNRLDEVNKNIDKLNLEKKKLNSFISDLKKQCNSLKKDKAGILKKEFKSRGGGTLKMKEDKKQRCTSVEKVSLNNRYYFRSSRTYSL